MIYDSTSPVPTSPAATSIVAPIPHEDVTEKIPLGRLLASGYLKRMLYVAIFIMCQVVPMYAIYIFGPDIMSAFGLGEGRASILGESAVSLFFLVGTIPAMFWLNSMGRRKLVILSLSMVMSTIS